TLDRLQDVSGAAKRQLWRGPANDSPELMLTTRLSRDGESHGSTASATKVIRSLLIPGWGMRTGPLARHASAITTPTAGTIRTTALRTSGGASAPLSIDGRSHSRFPHLDARIPPLHVRQAISGSMPTLSLRLSPPTQ